MNRTNSLTCRYPYDRDGVTRDRDVVIAELNQAIEIGARQADAGQLRDGRQVLAQIRDRRGRLSDS